MRNSYFVIKLIRERVGLLFEASKPSTKNRAAGEVNEAKLLTVRSMKEKLASMRNSKASRAVFKISKNVSLDVVHVERKTLQSKDMKLRKTMEEVEDDFFDNLVIAKRPRRKNRNKGT